MCDSWALCIYQTLLRNLTDNRINQIKKLIKLILRSVSCHEMVLSCNNGKKIMITNMITTSSTIFFYDNVMKHFTYIKNPYLNSQYENSQKMTQKNTYKGGLRDLPNMPKLWISLKPLALAQNSNNQCKNQFQSVLSFTIWTWNMALSTCKCWSNSTSNWTVFLGKIV